MFIMAAMSRPHAAPTLLSTMVTLKSKYVCEIAIPCQRCDTSQVKSSLLLRRLSPPLLASRAPSIWASRTCTRNRLSVVYVVTVICLSTRPQNWRLFSVVSLLEAPPFCFGETEVPGRNEMSAGEMFRRGRPVRPCTPPLGCRGGAPTLSSGWRVATAAHLARSGTSLAGAIPSPQPNRPYSLR